MSVQRLDPLTDRRWMAFVDSAGDATIFHHAAWLELLGRRYRYDISALCVCDGRGEILAGLPLARVDSRLTGRRLVALPFSDRCAAAHRAASVADVDAALADALVQERRRTGLPVEVRSAIEGISGAHVLPRFITHRLALQADADAVLARAKGQARRDAAKAVRGGVVVERRTDREGLEAFYHLHLRTRRRQGVPTQPKSFILAFEKLFARGLGFVMIARHAGRPIAAAVFMTYARTLTYKYSASDPQHLNLRPNHLFFTEAIRHGCEQGFAELDFGRTDLDNKGLASFKRSWGATQEELAYTYLADAPPAEGSRAAKRLIAEVIRRGPPVTGRVIGSALYRHVG